MIKIRLMKIEDALTASDVLCRSIIENCGVDHKNDEATIQQWISNKTPENLQSWLKNPNTTVLVAEIKNVLCGIGAFHSEGIILINYVSPEYRFQGVSKSLLTEMEKRLLKLGSSYAQLESTQTALHFYKSMGWLCAGKPANEFGIIGYPMKKYLKT